MATQLTDIAALEATTNGWRNALFSSDREKATVRYATVIYTVTGTETTADLIALLSLPIGSVVFPDLCRVSSDGIGGTGAITQIGDAGSAARYSATSIAVATAVSEVPVTTTNAIAVANPPYQVVAGNETLLATLTFATAITAGKLIVFRIAYILP